MVRLLSVEPIVMALKEHSKIAPYYLVLVLISVWEVSVLVAVRYSVIYKCAYL